MDAASKNCFSIVALVIAAVMCSDISTAEDNQPCTGTCTKSGSQANCCHESCCKEVATANSSATANEATTTGLATFVSDWLSQSPKFSAQFAIHFGPSQPTANKLGSDAPSVDVALGGKVISDQGVAGTMVAEPQTVISRPMKFTQSISASRIGALVSDVIACGHRICTGNKCYEVKDEPVTGTRCDTDHNTPLIADESSHEEILVVPMAPPAPPGQDIAILTPSIQETEAAAILRNSGLQHVKVPVPVSTVVDLLIAKTELSTRLEMAELLMNERQTAHEQYLALAERNSKLATQLAIAEARQHYTDALTASLMDRTELAIKIAANESKPAYASLSDTKPADASNPTVRAIQEDLSNIRRQIALLRRTQPVPFAPSYVGVPTRPYVPTAQLLAPTIELQVASPAEPESECGTESIAPKSNPALQP